MKQTFKFHTSCNTFNEDVAEIIIDFDERELIITEDYGDVENLKVGRDSLELKRLYKAIGNLLEEMEE